MKVSCFPAVNIRDLILAKVQNLSELLGELERHGKELRWSHTLIYNAIGARERIDMMLDLLSQLEGAKNNSPLQELQRRLKEIKIGGKEITELLRSHRTELESVRFLTELHSFAKEKEKEARELVTILTDKLNELQNSPLGRASSSEAVDFLNKLISHATYYFYNLITIADLLQVVAFPSIEVDKVTYDWISPHMQQRRSQLASQLRPQQPPGAGPSPSSQPSASETSSPSQEPPGAGPSPSSQPSASETSSPSQEPSEAEASSSAGISSLSADQIIARLEQRARYVAVIEEMLVKAETLYTNYVANLAGKEEGKEDPSYLVGLIRELVNWLGDVDVQEKIRNLVEAYRLLSKKSVKPVPVGEKEAKIDELIPPSIFKEILDAFMQELKEVSKHIREEKEKFSDWEKARIMFHIVSLEDKVSGLVYKAEAADRIYKLLGDLMSATRKKVESDVSPTKVERWRLASHLPVVDSLVRALLQAKLHSLLTEVIQTNRETIRQEAGEIKELLDEGKTRKTAAKLTLLTARDIEELFKRKAESGGGVLEGDEDASVIVNAYIRALSRFLNFLVGSDYNKFLKELNRKIGYIVSDPALRTTYVSVANAIRQVVSQAVKLSSGYYRNLHQHLSMLLGVGVHTYISTFISAMEAILNAPVSSEVPKDSDLRKTAAYILSSDLYLLDYLGKVIEEYGERIGVQVPEKPLSTPRTQRGTSIFPVFYQKSGLEVGLICQPNRITLKRVL